MELVRLGHWKQQEAYWICLLRRKRLREGSKMALGNKDVLKIDIHMSTNSFLYLPIYIAEDLKIFETVLEPALEHYEELKDRKIELRFFGRKENIGDENSIINMLKANDAKKSNVIAIAIGSPIAFLNSAKIKKKNKDKVKIVGALINKPTFWAVSKELITEKEDLSISDFKKHFKQVICQNEDFITGYYLGQRIRSKAKYDDSNLCKVSFGDELDKLTDGNSVAVTADIAKMTEKIAKNTGYICHRFSESQGEILTTGIITSKICCEKFPEIIEKIIESIQISIAILYSSQKKAIESCEKIAKTLYGTMTSSVIEKIIKRMNEERFYPSIDLSISEGSWNNASKALVEIQRAVVKKDTYTKYVDNSFVLKAIAKRTGIDLSTTKDRCKYNTNKNECKCVHIRELRERNNCEGIKCRYQKEYKSAELLIKFCDFFEKKAKHLLIILLAIFAIIFIILLKKNDNQIEAVKVAIFGDFSHYVLLYLANEKGFFATEKLKIEIIDTDNEKKVFAAVINDPVTFGITDPTFVAMAAEEGYEGKVIASIAKRIPLWGIAKKQTLSEVTDPSQLSGYSVATFPSPSIAYILQYDIFKKVGLEPNIKQGAVGTLWSMVEAGHADIALELEPNVSRALMQGGKMLYSLENYGDIAITGVVVSKKMTETSPVLVQRFVNALQKSAQWALAHQDSVVYYTRKHFSDIDTTINASAINRIISAKMLPENVMISEEAWEKAIKLRYEAGDIKSLETAKKVLDMSFAKKAIKGGK
ncbi:MAG: ABC transporter substrate-binding protein [Fibromonadaceae bacterium]|jgi:NitT/TauT family transport system substrate-binding protein|nr:ABC transporter substrate-binding protein [Fibromonadaceae bacterium]